MKSRSKRRRRPAAVFVGGPVDGAPMEIEDGAKLPKEIPIPWRSGLHRYSLRYYRGKKSGRVRFRYQYRGRMEV